MKNHGISLYDSTETRSIITLVLYEAVRRVVCAHVWREKLFTAIMNYRVKSKNESKSNWASQTKINYTESWQRV